MLLLAAMNAFGPDELEGILPLPKWQRNCARQRVSTQRLIQLLRNEVWGYAVEEIAAVDEPSDFVNVQTPDTKSPELPLAPVPPLVFARTG